MERRSQPSEGQRLRRRRRGMALLFTLLPSALALGLLAPDLVSIVEAQISESVEGRSPAERYVPDDKERLLVPRDYARGFVPELVDLRNLFSRDAFRPTKRQLSNISAFDPTDAEMIALDDALETRAEVAFVDMLAAASLPRASELLDDLLPLDGPIPRTNGSRYDDFTGGPPSTPLQQLAQVPEPSTALLLGAGLLLLSVLRPASA